MPQRQSDARARRELARLIRTSSLLDPLLKRRWLAVLEHLSSEDRERLRDILRQPDASAESGPDQPPQPPERP